MNISAERKYPTAVSSSPLLPLLLLSLARQKISPNTASAILNEYDYIIVGAGSGGSVVANRLSEVTCVNVLLLEAGKPPPILTDLPYAAGAFFNSDIDWQYSTVPQRTSSAGLINRVVPWTSGKVIGGSSVINTMYAIRGNRHNFDSWAASGATGWSYEEVLPYFLKLEDYTDLEYLFDGYHSRNGPLTVENLHYNPKVREAVIESALLNGYRFVDVNGPTQTGFYKVTKTTRDGQRCSAAKAYLSPAENRTNLDILPHAMVTKILIENHKAYGVQFDYRGRSYKVRARREVISSAGAVETPKLLMLSGIGPRSELEKFGIDVIADLPVGENLQDHIGVPITFILDEKVVTPLEKRITNETILEYINTRTGILSGTAGTTVVTFLKNPESRTRIDLPDFQLMIAEATITDGFQKSFNMDPQFFDKYFGPYKNKPCLICAPYTLNPLSRGFIRLRSANPYEKPIIDPKYFQNRQDLLKTVAGMKICQQLGNSIPLKELGSHPLRTICPGCEAYVGNEDSYLQCLAQSIGFTIYHKVGTAKMGRIDDPTTVVDRKLRVKGIDGLRVVDASVMPTVTSGNTNLPTIMIGEKGSDLIKENIRCPMTDCGFKLLKI